MCGPSLPADPYHPLLKLFELGGCFTREHRDYIDINRSAGIHAGMVESGNLNVPFVEITE
jgi:hypothetical protein